MSTSAGLTGISGQQLVTQLVPGQTMQGQVVHQATAPIGVSTTLASGLTQGQVSTKGCSFVMVNALSSKLKDSDLSMSALAHW